MLIVGACGVHAMRENRFEVLARTHNSHNTKQMISRYIDINPLTIKLAVVILALRFGPFWSKTLKRHASLQWSVVRLA